MILSQWVLLIEGIPIRYFLLLGNNHGSKYVDIIVYIHSRLFFFKKKIMFLSVRTVFLLSSHSKFMELINEKVKNGEWPEVDSYTMLTSYSYGNGCNGQTDYPSLFGTAQLNSTCSKDIGKRSNIVSPAATDIITAEVSTDI